jgi:hypothetical protein
MHLRHARQPIISGRIASTAITIVISQNKAILQQTKLCSLASKILFEVSGRPSSLRHGDHTGACVVARDAALMIACGIH